MSDVVGRLRAAARGHEGVEAANAAIAEINKLEEWVNENALIVNDLKREREHLIGERDARLTLEEVLSALPPALRTDELYLIRVGHNMARATMREQIEAIFQRKAKG